MLSKECAPLKPSGLVYILVKHTRYPNTSWVSDPVGVYSNTVDAHSEMSRLDSHNYSIYVSYTVLIRPSY